MAHPSDRCDSYAPGHRVHWIQARKAKGDDASWRPAAVEEVDPSGWIRLGIDGESDWVWNHDARSLRPGGSCRLSLDPPTSLGDGPVGG